MIKGENIMRLIHISPLLLVVLLAACSSASYATTAVRAGMWHGPFRYAKRQRVGLNVSSVPKPNATVGVTA
jgi:hypothetical protein